jgi:hypothetical protein
VITWKCDAYTDGTEATTSHGLLVCGQRMEIIVGIYREKEEQLFREAEKQNR